MKKTAVFAALTAAALAGCGAASASTSTSTSTWTVAQVTSIPDEDGIQAISVAPTGSTWAAGYQTTNRTAVPLVQHLSGGKWSTVTGPSRTLGKITALSAASSKNVWAFGENAKAAHWNGTHWTTSTLATRFHTTDAVTVSKTEAWAIGGDLGKYAEHWTGKSWKKVTLPAPATAITSVSGRTVWAVGIHKSQPAVMRWNGTSWKLLKTPTFARPAGDAAGELRDVLALGPNNVWAVGGVEWSCGEDGDDVCAQPITLHWNGRTWSKTVGAQGGSSYGQVASDGGTGIWLMLGSWNPTFVHRTGSTQTTVTAPRPGGHDEAIWSLASSGRTVWAGGAAFPEGDPDDPTGNSVYLRIG